MTPAVLQALLPVIAVLAVMALPLGMLFVRKWFRFQEKELHIDAELTRASGQAAALEQRMQRLESIVLTLDADVRAKLPPSDPSRRRLAAPVAHEGEQTATGFVPPARVR